MYVFRYMCHEHLPNPRRRPSKQHPVDAGGHTRHQLLNSHVPQRLCAAAAAEARAALASPGVPGVVRRGQKCGKGHDGGLEVSAVAPVGEEKTLRTATRARGGSGTL